MPRLNLEDSFKIQRIKKDKSKKNPRTSIHVQIWRKSYFTEDTMGANARNIFRYYLKINM